MTAASTAASSLPPVRTSCHVPLSLMTSISEETIALWLKLGALEKLEQAVLDGYGDQLCGKTSRIPQVNKFLKQVPLFQTKIREIHLAVSQGRLRDVQHLIDRKKLAFCRDHNGASPLHKAVIFGHQDVIEYLVKRYGGVIHIRDHQGRTALHYAAFLPDRGEIYQYLSALGADERAMDVYGRQPSYYLDGQNESTLRQLRDGSMLNGIRKIKPRYYGQVSTGQPFTNPNKMTVSKSQIRELISEGNLISLEDLVLQGLGDRLLGETSAIPKVQSFLNIVPMYMERIYDVHRAVMRDQLEHVVILLENRKLSLARDQLGATPLHKAVWFGHYKIAHFISHQFPETLNAIDLEGRTALHYAAALKDNKNMYGILIEAGANKGIYDNKGKMADYYSQYPEHLNLEEVIKRCHKVNANYLANTASRIKGKSPVRQTPPPSNGNLSSPRSEENNGSSKENSMSNDSGNENELISLLQKDKFTKRLDINSANIRRWVNSKDVEKLTKAVMEGYGDKVVRAHSNDESEDKDELASKITEMVERVNAIHTAVSSDDLTELQNHLDEKDFALAKDHMGMTPLHKAVLLRKAKIVGFLIEKFPEAINAKNKNGLTALHYAAAMSRKDGQQLYKLLLQAGADPKIRDNHGRTPDYYKTHLITMPNKGMMRTRPAGGRGTETLNRYSKQGILERMTIALQRGDVELLQDLVLEGHGKHLLGKTSWHEDVKNFLKELPTYINNIQSFHETVRNGDVDSVKQFISTNDRLMRARDDAGSLPLHIASSVQSSDVLEYFTKAFPNMLNVKDGMGKTALHIVSQKGNYDLQKMLKQSGADSKILDQKGKTADFYLQSSKPDSLLIKPSPKFSSNVNSENVHFNPNPKKPSNVSKRKSSTNNLQSLRKLSTPLILPNNNNEDRKDSLKETNDANDEASHNDDKDVTTDIETSIAQEDEDSMETSDVKENTDENEDEKLTSTVEEESGVENANDEDEAVATDDPTSANDTDIQTQEETQDENNESTAEPDETQTEIEDETVADDSNPENDIVIDEPENPEAANEEEDQAEPNPEESDEQPAADDNVEKTNEDATEEVPVPEDDAVVEEAEEPSEEGNEDLKDADQNEESPSQSEESNATVVEATTEPQVEENTSEGIENSKTEDEEDDNSEKIDEDTSLDKSDDTLNNIQSFEGKTVAEVGSGKMMNADSIELDDEQVTEEAAEEGEKEAQEETEEGEKGEAQEETEEGEIEAVQEETEDGEKETQEETEGNAQEMQEEEANEDTEETNLEEDKPENQDPEEQDGKQEETEDQPDSEEKEDVAEPEEDVNEAEEVKNEDSEENKDSGGDIEKETNEDEDANEEIAPTDENEPPDNDVIQEEVEPPKEDEPKEEPENENNQELNEESEQNTENATTDEMKSGDTTADAPHQTKDHLDELIEHWIKEGDLLRLEHVVLAGQGDRLIERTSDDKQVQDFLDLVPIYMAKIRAVHEAVAKGHLREVRSVLTRKRFALSRDHVGASPLHLGVLHGHTDVSTYIISHFPETMDGPDNEGRTPLHYAAALHDNGTLYRLLKAAGADENIEDKSGHSPKYYMSHPGSLTLTTLLEPYSTSE